MFAPMISSTVDVHCECDKPHGGLEDCPAPPPLQFLKRITPEPIEDKCKYEGEMETLIVHGKGYAIKGGLYKKVPGLEVNSKPVWCNGKWRLYSGASGKWLMSSSAQDMTRNKGFVRSSPHNGNGPHEVSNWQVHCSGGWNESDITVSTVFLKSSSEDSIPSSIYSSSLGELESFAFSDSSSDCSGEPKFQLPSSAGFKGLRRTPLVAPPPRISSDPIDENPRTMLHFLTTPPPPAAPVNEAVEPRYEAECVCSVM